MNQAKVLQARATGDDVSKVSAGIDKAFHGNDMGMIQIQSGMLKMQDVQQMRGTSALSRSVEEALFTEEGVKLDSTTRNRIQDTAAVLGSGNVSAIRATLADKDMRGALGKIGIGSAILSSAEGVTSLESKLKSGMSREQVRDTLKGTFKDENQLVAMTKLYESSGKDAVVNEALKSFQSNLATQGGIATASGSGSTSGADVKNADQLAAVQTSINMQTLAAMQGLAKKLGVQ